MGSMNDLKTLPTLKQLRDLARERRNEELAARLAVPRTAESLLADLRAMEGLNAAERGRTAVLA